MRDEQESGTGRETAIRAAAKPPERNYPATCPLIPIADCGLRRGGVAAWRRGGVAAWRRGGIITLFITLFCVASIVGNSSVSLRALQIFRNFFYCARGEETLAF
jgi:hypothetical protein